MNIFATYECPVESAQVLDDKRVIKMILESAQLLWNVASLAGLESAYKPTHVNHPCAIWVRQTRQNYDWLLQHFHSLCIEYRQRYKKQHACVKFADIFYDNREIVPEIQLLPFSNCTPHKDLPVHEAYRKTLLEKWAVDKRTPTWYQEALPEDQRIYLFD